MERPRKRKKPSRLRTVTNAIRGHVDMELCIDPPAFSKILSGFWIAELFKKQRKNFYLKIIPVIDHSDVNKRTFVLRGKRDEIRRFFDYISTVERGWKFSLSLAA